MFEATDIFVRNGLGDHVAQLGASVDEDLIFVCILVMLPVGFRNLGCCGAIGMDGIGSGIGGLNEVGMIVDRTIFGRTDDEAEVAEFAIALAGNGHSIGADGVLELEEAGAGWTFSRGRNFGHIVRGRRERRFNVTRRELNRTHCNGNEDKRCG